MAIKRLNHAVLYVRNAEQSAAFYKELLGFTTVEQAHGAIFLRAPNSENHHDLGVFSIGANAPGPSQGDRVGLYHLAWEVDSIEDLVPLRQKLIERNAFVGESDHGSSLSLYAMDPDENEFEVFWPVPEEEWQTRGFGTRRLALHDEIEKRKKTA